ncbi:DUF3885 domain-containing protein [Wenyingzhuangia sp. chi5]|uniref:DUF3885 domain-containing protein n=1 Tax=Wenyingzhuangia gilva TaxID=3057677 RepID=A0ABT8VVH8_9FLAO|nr:DUF3885 domain-containing protein [Wenyingzhuangia sp. chi5]MDO3695983.1 DUF3885 domain-containing protein [Wenyingzhuangia sp. chi5]
MKQTIREELKRLLPNTGIDSIFGDFSMRFELGGEGNSDSSKRIEQATERGIEIYNQLIGENEIIIVVEEWEDSWIKIEEEKVKENYLHKLLKNYDLKRIKGPFEQTYYEEDSNGKKVERIFEDKLECDLSIGKIILPLNEVKEIIRGIASLEMGGENFITQKVYFFCPKNNTGFNIYDDRGCDIWSKSIKELKHIYENLNSWILDYNRKEINEMFKNEKTA